jgi:hypothetical protein
MSQEWLGVFAHQAQVKPSEQIIATVTSTATKYRARSGVEEGGV